MKVDPTFIDFALGAPGRRGHVGRRAGSQAPVRRGGPAKREMATWASGASHGPHPADPGARGAIGIRFGPAARAKGGQRPRTASERSMFIHYLFVSDNFGPVATAVLSTFHGRGRDRANARQPGDFVALQQIDRPRRRSPMR
ncbi:hypothetical protein [Rhodovibrio sodomensis]|uniref:hypothetical protein n=1 Tax=Rhodovibrio sodomensis TaxID=1088 RepID=UPI001904E0E6|nr:hypothetical protein [Rhodovibrio sodomensis]